MGHEPAFILGSSAQRMKADSSTVAKMNTRLAGSASRKNLTSRRPNACQSLMLPASTSGRTEISGMSSQSISMKVGNTGMKNSTAISTAPMRNTAFSHARRARVTGGRTGSVAGSKSPRSRAGEPCHTLRAGTCWPLASADWPSRCPYSPMRVSPSITTYELTLACAPMSMVPRCSRPPSTRAFSRLTTLPMLAPSPMRTRCGTRMVTEPRLTSGPTLAPCRRSQAAYSGEPLIM